MEKVRHARLSEIAELVTKGTTPTTLGYEFQNEGVNFLKIECFDENGVFLENKVTHISDECHAKLKRSQLEAGDILFSIAGAIGRVAIVTEEMLPANTNQALAIIRISNEQIYLPYIKLILTSPIVLQQLAKKKQGVAQLNLSLKDINDLLIPLPSKEKQIEFAELFTKVRNVIFKRNVELVILDDLIKARFVEMFGKPFNEEKWSIKRLKEISESIADGSNIEKCYYQKREEVLFLRIQNVWFNEFRLEDSVYISNEVNSVYGDTSLHRGDLLITKIGRYYTKDSSLGRVAIYLGEDNKANYSNNIMRIRLKADVLGEYVNALMNLDEYNQFIRRVSVGGTDKRALSKNLIGEFPVIVPPIEKQKKMVQFIHQVNKSKLLLLNAFSPNHFPLLQNHILDSVFAI